MPNVIVIHQLVQNFTRDLMLDAGQNLIIFEIDRQQILQHKWKTLAVSNFNCLDLS